MKKDLQYYMSLPYREVIEADPNGGFVGHIGTARMHHTGRNKEHTSGYAG